MAKHVVMNTRRSVHAVLRDLRFKIELRGWKNIGGGYFSTAFAKAGRDKVIKIADRHGEEDRYLRYARWAIANQDLSPAVPRIDKLLEIRNGDWFGYAVEMEKLAHFEGVYGGCESERNTRPVRAAAKYLSAKRYGHRIPDTCHEMNELPEPVRKVLEAIDKEVIGVHGGHWDIKDDNVMLRPATGELVLTDPLC